MFTPTDQIYLPAFDYSLSQEQIKSVVIKDIKERIKVLKDGAERKLEECRRLRGLLNEEGSFLAQVGDRHLEEYKHEIEKLNKKVSWLNRKRLAGEDDWEKKKRLAKQVPITNFIKLNRAGFSICPFHSEKSPSFKYYAKTNTWHCFGSCSTGGDVIDFVMMQRSLDFREAINYLL